MTELHPPSGLATLPQTVSRGILPSLLLSQIENTVPFLFLDSFGEDSRQPHVSYLRALRRGDASIDNHVDYFRFCLSAHHATVASFVPTDVDNAIRSKLWQAQLPTEILLEMAQLVNESHSWSGRGLSSRMLVHEQGGPDLSGLLGEWYSTAAAAYGALRKRAPADALAIRDRILAEVQREERIFAEHLDCGDGIGVAKAATILAHNLGDLDRVIDLWNLPDDDPLRLCVYKRGHGGDSWSARAGVYNKAHMAIENHRHLFLRGPRCLRRLSELLLPIGPFFDAWGGEVARRLDADEVGKVAEALVDGWVKLPHTVGYARAIAGILETLPGGGTTLRRNTPSRIARALETGRLRTLIAVSESRFRASWANRLS